MSGSTSTDPTQTATITLTPDALVKSAALTAVGAAGLGYIMPALFPEGHFIKPAIHYFLASLAVLYVKPNGSVVQRSLGVGALMTGQLMMTVGAPIDGAVRYGAMASLAAYVSTEYIMPQLRKAEKQYIDNVY